MVKKPETPLSFYRTPQGALLVTFDEENVFNADGVSLRRLPIWTETKATWSDLTEKAQAALTAAFYAEEMRDAGPPAGVVRYQQRGRFSFDPLSVEDGGPSFVDHNLVTGSWILDDGTTVASHDEAVIADRARRKKRVHRRHDYWGSPIEARFPHVVLRLETHYASQPTPGSDAVYRVVCKTLFEDGSASFRLITEEGERERGEGTIPADRILSTWADYETAQRQS